MYIINILNNVQNKHTKHFIEQTYLTMYRINTLNTVYNKHTKHCI